MKIKVIHVNTVYLNGGEGGIRTPGTLASSTVFETVPFNRSGTSPWHARRDSNPRPLEPQSNALSS